MSTNVHARPYSTAERVFLVVTRVLTATFLTALLGAIGNWLYERFLAPELYAVGHPLARGVGMFALSFPYILLGLILLGLPTAYILSKRRAENVFTYAFAGAVAGTLWGKVALGSLTTAGIAISAAYGCLCALLWWGVRPRV